MPEITIRRYSCDALIQDGFVALPGSILPPDMSAFERCPSTTTEEFTYGYIKRHFCSAHIPGGEKYV